MDFVIRRMTFEDIAKTIELCDLCFDETTDLSFAKRQFEKNAEDRNVIYLIGLVESKIVAHLRIQFIETIYEDMGTYAILNHVCVHPEYRRHHLASKLLDETVKICENRGCKTIDLWSKNRRIAAHACYSHYGFDIEDAKFFVKNCTNEDKND